MKTNLLVVLTCCLGLVAGQFECPHDGGGQCVDGSYPSEEYGCEYYYTCVACQARLEQCPSGQHFDRGETQCKDQYQADCDPALISKSLFSVAANASATGPSNPVAYNEDIYNPDNAYDQSTDRFVAQSDGIYFFHSSVGLTPADDVTLAYRGAVPTEVYTSRGHQSHDTDVISRDWMQNVNMEDQIYMELLSGGSFQAGGNQRLTTWLGFGINHTMSNVVAFNSYRTNSQMALGTIMFTDNVVNVGGGYSTTTGVFTAPSDGLYFFSFCTSFDSLSSAEMRVHFVSGQFGSISEVWRGPSTQVGYASPDTLSMAVLRPMMVGETMHMELVGGEVIAGAGSTLSFQGFKYDPRAPPNQAWCRHSNSIQYGPVDPLVTQVDCYRGIYDISSHQAQVTVTGVYYISVSVGVCHSQTGGGGQSPVNVDVVVNNGVGDSVVASVVRSTPWTTHADTMRRDIMVSIPSGSSVRLRMNSGAVYSDGDLQTTFIGFLLHALE